MKSSARAVVLSSAIFGACIVLDAALLIPLKTIKWDYLGDLPLFFFSLAAVAAQLACLSAVCALWVRSWWGQIVCLALLLSSGWLVGTILREAGEVLVTSVLISYGFF
jgi:hypothetical protein